MIGASRALPSQPLGTLAPKTASGGKIRARRFAPAWSADKPLYRFGKIRHRGQPRVGARILANTIGNLVADRISRRPRLDYEDVGTDAGVAGGAGSTPGGNDVSGSAPSSGNGGISVEGASANGATVDASGDIREPIVVTADRHQRDMLWSMNGPQYQYYRGLAGDIYYNEFSAGAALNYTPSSVYAGLVASFDSPLIQALKTLSPTPLANCGPPTIYIGDGWTHTGSERTLTAFKTGRVLQHANTELDRIRSGPAAGIPYGVMRSAGFSEDAAMVGWAAGNLLDSAGLGASLSPAKSMVIVRSSRSSIESSLVGSLTLAAAESALPGAWRTVNESMSARSLAYQTQITGRSGEAFVANGVRFDGFEAGALLEAKGPGYATFVKNGEFRSWFRGQDALLDQALRQSRAANGAPVTWHVAESKAADAMRALFATDRRIQGITVVHTPVGP